jgi:hypothetical protein
MKKSSTIETIPKIATKIRKELKISLGNPDVAFAVESNIDGRFPIRNIIP